MGALVGHNTYGASISTSYATGTVTGNDYTGDIDYNYVGGLVGRSDIGDTITDSYFEVSSGGSGSFLGKTTSELQSPTDYTGIYENWNLDLDNADGDYGLTTGKDDPWDFGTNSQYPTLKADFDGDRDATWHEFGYQVRQPFLLTATLTKTGSGTQVSLTWNDVTETSWPGSPKASYVLYRNAAAAYNGQDRTYTDTGLTIEWYTYQVALLLNGVEATRSAPVSVSTNLPRQDSDGDGLIEISSLAQLDAIRYDLDGDGLPSSNTAQADRDAYSAAFPVAGSGTVCTSGDTCVGYELTAEPGLRHRGRRRPDERRLSQRRRRLAAHRGWQQ